MKTINLLVLVMIISSAQAMAQSDSITEINFTYDAAGNRIKREVVYYESAKKGAPVATEKKEEIEPEKGLNVYPNPTSHSLFVTLNQEVLEEDNRLVIIFDNLGKQVLQMPAHQEVIQLDVSTLINGTFILKLIYGSRHKEWIIIKN